MENTAVVHMSISDWLTRFVGSHDILEASQALESFRKETGIADARHEDAFIRVSITVKEARKEIEARGVGGYVNGAEGQYVVAGHDLACALARLYVPTYSRAKFGRGSAYWEAVKALQDAGR